MSDATTQRLALIEELVNGGGGLEHGSARFLMQQYRHVERIMDSADQDFDDTIRQRDAREDQLERLAVALGCTSEWSNLHDHGQCVFELVENLVSENNKLREENTALNKARGPDNECRVCGAVAAGTLTVHNVVVCSERCGMAVQSIVFAQRAIHR